MSITSAKFVKGVVGADELLDDGTPQIAFIGRSNVGKSSVINSLAGQGNLAKTSSFPGRTQEVNIFLVSAKGGSAAGNKAYWVDLPGYGFAKGSKDMQKRLQQLIYWYLFDSPYIQKKVALILDVVVGPTENDTKILHTLEEYHKDVVVIANKVDKLKNSEYKPKLAAIQDWAGEYKVIPFSAEKKIGTAELTAEILN